MTDRITAYNQEIEKIKATAPKYDELAVLWADVLMDRMLTILKERYKSIGLTEEQQKKMGATDVDSYKKTLTEEQFRIQLDELHKETVAIAVKQLEFERDNPDKANTRSPNFDPDPDHKSTFEVEFIKWVASRIEGNIEGAKKERGELAKALRGAIGISIEDIGKYGILGGDNSYLRKIIPTWSDGGGFFGGENSFFRKPFG